MTQGLDLHLTRGLSDEDELSSEDDFQETIRLARPTEWSDDDDAMSDIHPSTSRHNQDDTNVEMESSESSSSDNEMEQTVIPTKHPDLTRYR